MRLEMPWVQSTHGSTTNNHGQPDDCPHPTVCSERHPQICARPAQRSCSAACLLEIIERGRRMGVSTNYLGHVEIGPSLNQAEYDYLHAFARSRRSYPPEGPYAVSPEDPHAGSGEQEVELYNQIADGQPGYWCQWVPCPHGCCPVWDGHEKFYAGPAWLQYLIDHFLRRSARTRTIGGSQFAGFSFDHEMNGMIVGEQGDNRELFRPWLAGE
jgi:hypothetical protein